MKRSPQKPRIGNISARQSPELIGDLPFIDVEDPNYQLLQTEFKPWDGSEPIIFTPDKLIKVAFSKMIYLMRDIRLVTDGTFAEADIHRFLQGRHVDPIQGAILYQVERRGTSLLYVRAAEEIEVCDPRIADIGLGHIDDLHID